MNACKIFVTVPRYIISSIDIILKSIIIIIGLNSKEEKYGLWWKRVIVESNLVHESGKVLLEN